MVNAMQVQSTNDASIVSKCSMAKNNYIKDEFVKYFVQKEKSRASLIHLGYYTRAVIVSEILTRFVKFLHCNEIFRFQIISCGAGFDTTYWKLAGENLLSEKSLYIEIDYPDVISRKFRLIKQSEKLCELLRISDHDEIQLVKKLNSNYYMLSVDLCDIDTIEEILRRINIDFDVPTLFLSECVMSYMKATDSDKLMKWITDKFFNCGFFNYEQIHPEDGFGNIMMKHFNKRQSTLHSVATYPDCSSHKKRYHLVGFDSSVVLSEWDFFINLTDLEERKRILALEQFDEFEEFHMKCTHYVVGLSANNILSGFLSEFDFPSNFTNEECSTFRFKEKNEILELFGHSNCSTGSKIFIFGGYSYNGRSKKVRTFCNSKLSEIRITGGGNVRFDAIHGSVASFELNGKSYIGTYGGRTAPNNVINNGDFIILEHCMDQLSVRAIFSCEDGPVPRYRSSVIIRAEGPNEVSAWIFGGRTPNLMETLSDFWRLIIHSHEEKFRFEWIKMEKDSAPSGRMAHSAVVCSSKNIMYITGGLDTRNFTVLNDIWKWSFTSESWEEIKPEIGHLIPRYGHTTHILGNVLYMIGGVNTNAGCQPGVSLFHLDKFTVTEYSLEPFRIHPVLLFNHSSVILTDNEKGEILIFGGGGNCFSFGTYFNKNVQSITLKHLVMK